MACKKFISKSQSDFGLWFLQLIGNLLHFNADIDGFELVDGLDDVFCLNYFVNEGEITLRTIDISTKESYTLSS